MHHVDAIGQASIARLPVWRLRGSTPTPLDCFVVLTPSSLYAVSVQRASDALVAEIYPDRPSAMARAAQIRDLLLASGSWRLMPVAIARR